MRTLRTFGTLCTLGTFCTSRTFGTLGTLLLVSACAARGPSPQLMAEMGKADLLIREGCYRCMEDALAMYERLAASPRPPLEARRRAFETAVLLATRAKELGIVADTWLTRARLLAQQVAPVLPPALPPSAYLDAAELFVGETSGLDPEVRQSRAQRLRLSRAPGVPALPARTALEPALQTDLVAQYLALALDCEDARARNEIKPEEVLARHGAVPLIRYRVALCAFVSRLELLREEDPRWSDTLLFEGRRQLTLRPEADVLKAAEHFSAARAAFPDSTAITMALGNAQNALSEYDAALATFAVVLKDEPTHRDALLGRVMSLSYLTRHPEAVASATKMIELGTWHIGDAYYWRAWNRYSLKELDTAWDDVERAITLQRNTSVYTLAGFIAWARQELDTAIDRFDLAFKMDSTNCEAVWSGALVHVDQQTWPPAAPKFSRAMSCFVSAAAQARADIAVIEKATYAEAVKTKRFAAAQKRLETAEHRKAQAAYNAASTYLRLGQKGFALNHADVAVEHPLLMEKAVALKAAIEKMPH